MPRGLTPAAFWATLRIILVYIRCRQVSETKRLLRHYGKYQQAALRVFSVSSFQ